MWLAWESVRLACTEAWVQVLVPHKLGMVAHACNPSTGELEIGQWAGQGHFGLHRVQAQCGPQETQSLNNGNE